MNISIATLEHHFFGRSHGSKIGCSASDFCCLDGNLTHKKIRSAYLRHDDKAVHFHNFFAEINKTLQNIMVMKRLHCIHDWLG